MKIKADEVMEVTKEQFIKAKRKVVIDFFGFNLIGSGLGVLCLWAFGSVIAWDSYLGNWGVYARIVFAILSMSWVIFITANLILYSAKCLRRLRDVKTQEELKKWCRIYYFRYVE